MTTPSESSVTQTVIRRMKGAAALDVHTFEEVEADITATGQAAAVVAAVAVAQAIGAVGRGGPGIVTGLVGGFVAWALWSGATYLIGTKLFKGTATWGEMLRTIGFAHAPGVLLVFGLVPFLGELARLIIAIWMLIAAIIAVRQGLDFSTGKAVITAFLGWIAVALLTAFLGLPSA